MEKAVKRADLDRSPVPRYLQLSTLYRRRIDLGEWKSGEQIPTVDDLSAESGVARATVRQALGLLETDGLISRFRAKGTFVNVKPQDRLWLEVETDWNGLLSTHEGARIEILSNHRKAAPPVLPHPVGNLVPAYSHLRRRHWLKGAPFLVADVYIEQTLASRIPRSHFSELTALRLISGVPGVKIADAHQTLTIGAADLEIAELLSLQLNAPVARVSRSVVDRRSRIILISNGVYPGDIVRVDTKLR